MSSLTTLSRSAPLLVSMKAMEKLGATWITPSSWLARLCQGAGDWSSCATGEA